MPRYGPGQVVITDLSSVIDPNNVKSYTSGSTVTDFVSGVTNTMTNGLTIVDGHYDLDGVDDHSDMNGTLLTPGVDGTISIWFKTDSSYSNGETLYNTYKNNSFFDHASLQIVLNENSARETMKLDFNNDGFTMYFLPAGNIDAIFGYLITIGQYHNFTLTHDSTNVTSLAGGGRGSQSHGIRGYFDGVPVDIYSQNGSTTGWFNTTGQNSTNIGSRRRNVDTNQQNFGPGEIGNIMMWDKILTGSEVLQNYDALKDRFI